MVGIIPDDRLIRTITIEETESAISTARYFTVRIGDRYQDKLDGGECLWLIVSLIGPKENGGYCVLKTKEEHEAQEARWRNELAEARL